MVVYRKRNRGAPVPNPRRIAKMIQLLPARYFGRNGEEMTQEEWIAEFAPEEADVCPTCDGTGEVEAEVRVFEGGEWSWFTETVDCPDCEEGR
jgi:hypothetical protein